MGELSKTCHHTKNFLGYTQDQIEFVVQILSVIFSHDTRKTK